MLHASAAVSNVIQAPSPAIHQVLISPDPQAGKLQLSVELGGRWRKALTRNWLLRLDRVSSGRHQQWQGQVQSTAGWLEIQAALTEWPMPNEPTRLRLWLRDPDSSADWVLAEDSQLP